MSVSVPQEQGVVEGGGGRGHMDWEHLNKSPRVVVKAEEDEGVENRAADQVSVSSNLPSVFLNY